MVKPQVEDNMPSFSLKYFNLKFSAILVLGFCLQANCYAQDWNNQSAAELQQIREMRLLEWHAQQQGQVSHQQSDQYVNQEQNISSTQPYQQAAAPVVPEKDDLFNAANSGNTQQLQKLISQGINVNAMNGERETALHMAAARGHFETVMLLVRSGANVNAQTVKNWIPLHHAVRFRHPNIVNFLIQNGAWANGRTSDGLSAIDMANNNRDYRILSIMNAR